MAGKAKSDMEILQPAGPGSEDRVVVEAILVVMPGPGARHLERLEGRDALGETGPDRLVEIRVVDLPVEPGRLVITGVAADIASSLRAEADIAADMPGQRHRFEFLANLEIEGQPAHRRDRHLHPELL